MLRVHAQLTVVYFYRCVNACHVWVFYCLLLNPFIPCISFRLPGGHKGPPGSIFIDPMHQIVLSFTFFFLHRDEDVWLNLLHTCCFNVFRWLRYVKIPVGREI